MAGVFTLTQRWWTTTLMATMTESDTTVANTPKTMATVVVAAQLPEPQAIT